MCSCVWQRQTRPLISRKRWNNWHLAVFHDFIWGDGVISSNLIFSAFTQVSNPMMHRWEKSTQSINLLVNLWDNVSIIHGICSLIFALHHLHKGVIVFFSLPSNFWAWALLCPLAVLVQNKRHVPWLTFSGGPWDSSDYKCLLVMAPTGCGVPGVWKQSGVIWAVKDTMHYAAAVKFLRQCQGLMLCCTQCIRL